VEWRYIFTAFTTFTARRERPRNHRAAEQRDEFAPFYLIELHSVRCQQVRAGLQDIEPATNSQRVLERLYNLLAVGEGSGCPLGVDPVEKGLVNIDES
jgi:hypothetical protein